MYSIRSTLMPRVLASSSARCLTTTSLRLAASPGEGIGAKKPAASDEGQGPISKRTEGLKNTVKEAASTVKNAVGAGSNEEATGTEQGATSSNANAKTGSFVPDFQNEEEAKKGKKAGTMKRDRLDNSN